MERSMLLQWTTYPDGQKSISCREKLLLQPSRQRKAFLPHTAYWKWWFQTMAHSLLAQNLGNLHKSTSSPTRPAHHNTHRAMGRQKGLSRLGRNSWKKQTTPTSPSSCTVQPHLPMVYHQRRSSWAANCEPRSPLSHLLSIHNPLTWPPWNRRNTRQKKSSMKITTPLSQGVSTFKHWRLGLHQGPTAPRTDHQASQQSSLIHLGNWQADKETVWCNNTHTIPTLDKPPPKPQRWHTHQPLSTPPTAASQPLQSPPPVTTTAQAPTSAATPGCITDLAAVLKDKSKVWGDFWNYFR